MEVRSQELSSLWKGIDLGERGYFYIADASGQVVYQPEGLVHNASSPAEDPKLTAAIMGADEESFKYTTADGEQRVFMTRMSPYSGWRLVASMPLEEWRKPIASIRSTVWTIGDQPHCRLPACLPLYPVHYAPSRRLSVGCARRNRGGGFLRA